MIQVRPAREPDYDALAQIWAQGWILPEAGITEVPPGREAELRARLPRAVEAGGSTLFAAEDDTAVVGLLAITREDRVLNQLFVEQTRRSRGIGKAMLDHARQEMPEGFWLRTRVENVRARRFYEREGMVLTHVAPHPLYPEAVFAHYAWKIDRAAMFRIRRAREDEYDIVTDIWKRSWESIGLRPNDVTFEQLRERLGREVAQGWSLYVAVDVERIVAMLALDVSDKHLDQLFVDPGYQGLGIGKTLLAFARAKMPDEMWLRTAVKNARAVAWYEREGFVKVREETEPGWSGPRAYYRWKNSLLP
jgi:ribosomal protein S18 acetylase RimI-like enzyme